MVCEEREGIHSLLPSFGRCTLARCRVARSKCRRNTSRDSGLAKAARLASPPTRQLKVIELHRQRRPIGADATPKRLGACWHFSILTVRQEVHGRTNGGVQCAREHARGGGGTTKRPGPSGGPGRRGRPRRRPRAAGAPAGGSASNDEAVGSVRGTAGAGGRSGSGSAVGSTLWRALMRSTWAAGKKPPKSTPGEGRPKMCCRVPPPRAL